MKILFSKDILIFNFIFLFMAYTSASVYAESAVNNSGTNLYPATVQETKSVNSSNTSNKFLHKVQQSYNNTASGLKSKLSAGKNNKTNKTADDSETVRNIIPDIYKKSHKNSNATKVAMQSKTKLKFESRQKQTSTDNTQKMATKQNNIKSSLSSATQKAKNSFTSKFSKKAKSAEMKQADAETVQNIIPKQETKKKSSNQIKNLKSVFKKKQKPNDKKLHFEKGSLTQIDESRNIKNIKEHINNEDYFKHDVKNKLYLDRFKTFGNEEDKSVFYAKKNIYEDENGDIQLKLNNGKTVDQLMDEIEQSNPDEPGAKPVNLTLRDSIAIAIAKHPDILSAKLDTAIYKDRILVEWSSYFPTFSAGVNWGHDHTKYHGQDFSYGYNSVYLPTVSADMLLFDFGKTKTSVDVAKTEYDASRYDLQDSISTIIYSIKNAYYNVLFAEKQIEVYKKTIEDYDLQLASAQKYFSIGKKAQIDVLMAEYNAGNAKLNLVKVNNTLENAKVSFANTLGLPEFANFELIDGLPYVEYNIDLEDLLKDAFSIRPDLLSYEKNVESSYLAVRQAKRRFTPDLTASGGLSYSDIDDSNSSNYRVGVGLSYGALNFLELKKSYDLAKKQYDKALVAYDSVRQRVYLEVKQAYIDFNNVKQSVKQAELNVKQAKAQHYHATGRYKAGFGDALEIKDAENTYLNAQLAYYQALLDYNLSLAELERVVGRPIENIDTNDTNANNAGTENSTNGTEPKQPAEL